MVAILALGLTLHARVPLVYSSNAEDPWNVIRGLLLSESEDIPRRDRLPGWTGDDAPEFFFAVPRHAARKVNRRRALLLALDREASMPDLRSRSIEAQLLFQQDLWRAFDENSGSSADAADLRSRVGRLMARLAPPRMEMAQLRTNWSEIAVSIPSLGPYLLEGDAHWQELRAVTRSGAATTQHAVSANWRRIVRRFVQLPPGARLEVQYSPSVVALLPAGAQAVLVETLVAVARNGELLEVPLVVGLEIRQIDSGGLGSYRAVFKLSTLALAEGDRMWGGLRLIPEEADVRSGLDCYPFATRMQPLGKACDACHAPSGRMVQPGVGAPGELLGFELLASANSREHDLVLQRKAATVQFRALRAFFKR
jgi:hypothetical protein